MANALSIATHFVSVPDPRCCRLHRHSLVEILTLALCAVVSGADTFAEMERFARSKQDGFRREMGLSLSQGVPSHDTFGRMFAALDAQTFGKCLQTWTENIAKITKGEVIALDGKVLRHSFDKACGQAPLQMVSAWAGKNRLVLAHRKVEGKDGAKTNGFLYL